MDGGSASETDEQVRLITQLEAMVAAARTAHALGSDAKVTMYVVRPEDALELLRIATVTLGMVLDIKEMSAQDTARMFAAMRAAERERT